MKGTVKRVLDAKNFGFILGEDGVEYFFHKQDLADSWDDLTNDIKRVAAPIDVTFEIVKSQRGPRAGNVERLFGKGNI